MNSSFRLVRMSTTERDKEYINIEDVDREDLFTPEDGTSLANTGTTTDIPKMTNEEIERYDRLIQVCPFSRGSSYSLGSV